VQQDDAFYSVLGLLLGRLAGQRIPVIDNIEAVPLEDQLKALGAAAASSGAVALFHIVGVTPEAPTREAAFQGRAPLEEHTITMQQLRDARRELTTAAGTKLDMVVLGSPHFSLAEFRQLAPLLKDKQRHPDVQFLVTTSRIMRDLAAQSGILENIEAFGARITVDTCVLATPMLPKSIKVLMTNSGKYAHYAPGLLSTQMVFGSMADCVESAVAGRVVRDDSLWQM